MSAISSQITPNTVFDAVDVMPVVLQRFPPAAMTADVTLLNGHGAASGTYTASVSGSHKGLTPAFRAFNRLTSESQEGWQSSENYHETGKFHGSANLGGKQGEWIALKLPRQAIVDRYSITRSATFTGRVPRKFVLLASNDGTTWAVHSGGDGFASATDYHANTPTMFFIDGTLSSGGSGTLFRSDGVADQPFDHYAFLTEETTNASGVFLTDLSLYEATYPTPGAIRLGDIRGHVHNQASIGDGSITTAKLKDGAVTAAKIATGAVTPAKVQDNSILTAQLADRLIPATNGAIAASAITTAKLPTQVIKFGAGATSDLPAFTSNSFKHTTIYTMPPSGMNGAEWHAASGYSWGIEQIGIYYAWASSEHGSGNFPAWHAFNSSSSGVGWHSYGINEYNSSGVYVGNKSVGGVAGEWIKLRIPVGMSLSSVWIAPRNDTHEGIPNRHPRDFRIMVSNDGSTWSTLASMVNMDSSTFATGTATAFYLTSARTGVTIDSSVRSKRWTNIALVVQKTNGGDCVHFPYIRYKGTPYADGITEVIGYGNLAHGLALGANMGTVNGYDRAGGGHVLINMAQANGNIRYGLGLGHASHKFLGLWCYNSSGAYLRTALAFYRDGHIDIHGSISAADGFDGPSTQGVVPVGNFSAGRNEVNATSGVWETNFPIGTAVLYYDGVIAGGGGRRKGSIVSIHLHDNGTNWHNHWYSSNSRHGQLSGTWRLRGAMTTSAIATRTA